MARRAAHKSKRIEAADSPGAEASIPAAEAFSFLRDTRSVLTWTARDLANSLKITLSDAKQVISILELQGYVRAHGTTELVTTIAGEGVSGSKPPRFTRERIEKSLEELRKRIAETNQDRRAPYRVTKAIAFGGFLAERVRVQSAQVGIELERRGSDSSDTESAIERAKQERFLKQLAGRSAVLHIRSYEAWMSNRTHVSLLG